MMDWGRVCLEMGWGRCVWCSVWVVGEFMWGVVMCDVEEFWGLVLKCRLTEALRSRSLRPGANVSMSLGVVDRRCMKVLAQFVLSPG